MVQNFLTIEDDSTKLTLENGIRGQVIESREDLNQWQFDETNLSGSTYQVENVNETLG